MKTRLLRKLRKEAKRRIKIINPLTELYNRYYIEKTIIKHFNVEKEWFHYPSYGCFLNTKSGFFDLATAIKLLPIARKEYILSEFLKATERIVKAEIGDDYKIADFLITEITPL